MTRTQDERSGALTEEYPSEKVPTWQRDRLAVV